MASTTCVNPNNQFIYQALLDKAASYPADKTYQIKAYEKAAASIAAHKKSIYDEVICDWWSPLYIQGIGHSIEDFINKFIKENPQPTTSVPVSVPTSTPAPASVAIPVAEPVKEKQEPTRCSARLKYKPAKSYKYEDPYDSEDIPDDAEVDDERDEDYVPNKDEDDEEELMRLFRKETKKFNLTDDELKEVVRLFEAYYEANKDNKDEHCIWYRQYACKTDMRGEYIMRSIRETVADYIRYNCNCMHGSLSDPVEKYHNPIIFRAYFNTIFKEILIEETGKMGIEYDERLLSGLWKWFMDPANMEQTHDVCPYRLVKTWFRRPRNEIAQLYIKTLPKKVIF